MQITAIALNEQPMIPRTRPATARPFPDGYLRLLHSFCTENNAKDCKNKGKVANYRNPSADNTKDTAD
jgi:hypothetical protein